jgi:hypothetical protein
LQKTDDDSYYVEVTVPDLDLDKTPSDDARKADLAKAASAAAWRRKLEEVKIVDSKAALQRQIEKNKQEEIESKKRDLEERKWKEEEERKRKEEKEERNLKRNGRKEKGDVKVGRS